MNQSHFGVLLAVAFVVCSLLTCHHVWKTSQRLDALEQRSSLLTGRASSLLQDIVLLSAQPQGTAVQSAQLKALVGQRDHLLTQLHYIAGQLGSVAVQLDKRHS